MERQIYDKARAGGLMNLYEAVFRKVMADEVLPDSALESLEAFAAHMCKVETQVQFLEYYRIRCSNDNQKKGVVAMLFTAAGVDASFPRARKKTVAKAPIPASGGAHAQGAMDILTQAAVAAVARLTRNRSYIICEYYTALMTHRKT